MLEQSGKLLRKTLKLYCSSSKAVDGLVFKDVFRHAVKHNIIDADACDRWFTYRDNRNNTAHDYGESFAEETLVFLPQFIIDALNIAATIKNLKAI
ncbi:MAG: nucleotidyltransferase substrate binding protein [Parafilimonas sp.]